MTGLSLRVRDDPRLPGIAATVLVHLALIIAWDLARTLPPVQVGGSDEAIQWIRQPAPARPVVETVNPRPDPAPTRVTRITAPADAPLPREEVVVAPATTIEPQAGPTAAAILDSARRSVGDIDRALRKERQPTVVAPPDSPQIRMRDRMELARSLAPSSLWEAPKVEELVNNTGDGARRTRVITGNGTYCITERSPVTSIDMIEKHGKQRFTNCPEHEEPAKRQVWRTARD